MIVSISKVIKYKNNYLFDKDDYLLLNDNIKVIVNEIVKLITVKVSLDLFEFFWRVVLIGQVPNFRRVVL